MRVDVLSRRAVEDGAAEGADAVVSIRPSAPERMQDLEIAVLQAVAGDFGGILVLTFDDVGIPAYGPYRGPTMEDAAEIVAFGRSVRAAGGARLVAHCEHGVSRSAAAALAVLADAHGPGREAEAVRALLRQDVEGRMHPNPLLVRLADACLLRCGALEAALAEASPRYVRWRDHWAEVARDPDSHWELARRVRFRRRTA